MSSAFWDWAAIQTGLRVGWLPLPSAILWPLILLSLATAGVFFWKRRWLWLDISCVIWGILLADTPYVIVLPLTVWFAWTQSVRLVRWITRDVDRVERVRAPWGRFGFIFTCMFIFAAAANFFRFDVEYLPGYARGAVAAIRWDGGWHPIDAARMDDLLDEYVRELVREGEGRQWIFTDGLCDSGIDLAADGKLRAVSLASGAEGDGYWHDLGFTRWEDLAALEGGACGLLRAWTIDRPENLTNAVFQCGFAFLEQEAHGKVEPWGLVMRSKGDAHSESPWPRVKELGERIVDFYQMGSNSGHGGRLRSVRFGSMQWRVARALKRRARELDKAQRTDEALAMTALSEKLDELNPYARKRDPLTETADLRTFGSVTPREGLAFALRRANFSLARQFAAPILKDDPKNAEANFAMAMSHLMGKEYTQARHYLEAALASRPDDPALLNNLAVVLLELGEVDAAKAKAEAALKLKPDSAAIQDTLRRCQK